MELHDLPNFLEELKSFNIEKIIEEVIRDNEDNVLNTVRGQLWDGKTPEGKDITPSYLADPYFKTREQAQGYIAWKQKITPNPDRNPITPNLFINGYFHSRLEIEFEEDGFLITNNTSLGRDVIAKYGFDTFGVNDNYLTALQAEIINKIEEKWNLLTK